MAWIDPGALARINTNQIVTSNNIFNCLAIVVKFRTAP